MKLVLPSIVFLILFFSCNSPSAESAEIKTIITGQVSGYAEVSDHDMVKLMLADPVSGTQEISTTLDSMGRFRFEPEVEYPREFVLNYSGHLHYFVYPGDSLYFEIDGKCWSKISESEAEEYAYYTLSGPAEPMGNHVAAYTAFFLDSLSSWIVLDSVVRASDPMEFRAFIDKQTNERRGITEAFNRAHSAREDFQDWAEMKITLAQWGDLIMYCWFKPSRENLERISFIQSLPPEYFNFLDDWDREDREYLKNYDYEYFIQQYQMILDQLVPLDTQQYYQDVMRDDFAKAAAYRPRYYSEAESGYAKDLLVANYYYRLLDAKYYNKISHIIDSTMIEDDDARTIVMEKIRYEKELFENMEFADGSKFREIDMVEDFFGNMTKNYPGKVIYVDFWATWCSPCMMEMPYAKKIKEQFKGKDVVFVYLANRCEEDAWKATIAELEMEGEHYLLTDEQFGYLTTEFSFTGIPRYILADRQGEVVNFNAPRPSSGEELIGLINQYLN